MFPKNPKKSKKASSAVSAAFATSKAYLASFVCLIVLQNKAKNKSWGEQK
jgi:hypothetical protein